LPARPGFLAPSASPRCAPGTRRSNGDVAAREAPDVLIEDNCECIGASEITYPQVPSGTRARIKSIVIPEFAGIDHLPDDPQALLAFGNST
jgi:hypothetical protein